MKFRIPLAVGGLAVSAALVLGSCSGSDHSDMSSGDMSSGGAAMGASTSTVSIPDDATFNATDVGFAQGMIPHHAQAVEMADMALDQTTNADVIRLATAIKAAQQPEIDQLTGWLEAWGQPVPDTAAGADHDMDDMSGMMMSGMMSAGDMQRLGDATGTDFDRMWLEMMILHHEGAISMADDEIAGGKYPDTIALAESIRTSQQAEITEMESLVAALAS